MNDEQQLRKESEIEVDLSVDLALERTLLALERTQLAWVRTVMTLITAGIAIDKGTQALHEARLSAGEAWVNNGHFGGLFLTISGTAVMFLATFTYIRRIGQLNQKRGIKRLFPSTSSILSIIICLSGLLSIYFLLMPW